MALKFKERKTAVKKVLIYGEDGSGKSTFAETYCNENNLRPVCIDIDDTNYTNVPLVELDLSNDLKAYRNIKQAIADIITDGSFDTIIIDGVTSMLELFVSKAKGLKKYSDRAERFNDVLRDLLNSKMNLIFIGQIDMKAIHNDEFQSPKPVIKINSLVNEKYLCYHKKEGYSHKVIKYRAVEPSEKPKRERPKKLIKDVAQGRPERPTRPEPKVINEKNEQSVFKTAAEVGEPDPNDDPLRHSCQLIKDMIEKEGKLVNKVSMKTKVFQLIQDGILPPENEDALVDYINKHCPEELD